ncbi:long-chain-fatty-acid--CoA ligase [Alkalihalobacillus sp. LMS39]|uniref:class I adenylate-forming enzyme family protein n=1 Tax=Alkalihalobacillus sp. LMS39 TaxID=2924032 RepID=UPI001FB3B173|nr:long-chain-fatty-acid--CoA ligase [Alkalihalobacillus sp. LMS39]UOE92689.1 long-chain-fatty-acid--CoA ligase [Alkalihalobacillus sp. LMS39]
MNYKQSLPEVLEEAYLHYPDKEAMYDGLSRLTYRELFEDVQQLASGLAQLGIKKGDRVVASLPNWNEFVTIYFGLARLGAILVPCNTRYRKEELDYILEDCRAKVAFIAEETGHLDTLLQYLKASGNGGALEHIVTVRFQKEGHTSYAELLDLGDKRPAPAIAIDPVEDVFSILYTSGTTGRPKGAMLTHKNVVHTSKVSAEFMNCTSDDVFLVAVPAFHVFGMVPGILSAISTAGKIVFMEQFKADKALKLIEQEKISVHHGVPTMFILELNHSEFKYTDLSSLRTGIIAAAPCPVEIVKKIRTEMGCDVVVSYGLTESSAGVTFTSFEDDDLLRSETVGKVMPGAMAKIVDSNRNELAVNEVGELAIKSFGVMKGYFQLQEKTNEVMDHEGWFYTGDLATIDESGYIRIVGRKKEMIIRGGYNIYPREIEEIFYKHPSVLEVAVIGLPDTVLGEVTCAAVKLKPNQQEDEQSMRDYVKGKIANYKIPDHFIFLEDLPMTASGKIKKMALETHVREKLKAILR